MIAEIELHDSELVEVDLVAGTLLIDAYVYRSGQEIQREYGRQRVLFRLQNLQVGDPDADIAGDGVIIEDRLSIAGSISKEPIVLPSWFESEAELKLIMRDGRELAFLGETLIVEEAGLYKFRGYWPPA